MTLTEWQCDQKLGPPGEEEGNERTDELGLKCHSYFGSVVRSHAFRCIQTNMWRSCCCSCFFKSSSNHSLHVSFCPDGCQQHLCDAFTGTSCSLFTPVWPSLPPCLPAWLPHVPCPPLTQACVLTPTNQCAVTQRHASCFFFSPLPVFFVSLQACQAVAGVPHCCCSRPEQTRTVKSIMTNLQSAAGCVYILMCTQPALLCRCSMAPQTGKGGEVGRYGGGSILAPVLKHVHNMSVLGGVSCRGV